MSELKRVGMGFFFTPKNFRGTVAGGVVTYTHATGYAWEYPDVDESTIPEDVYLTFDLPLIDGGEWYFASGPLLDGNGTYRIERCNSDGKALEQFDFFVRGKALYCFRHNPGVVSGKALQVDPPLDRQRYPTLY